MLLLLRRGHWHGSPAAGMTAPAPGGGSGGRGSGGRRRHLVIYALFRWAGAAQEALDLEQLGRAQEVLEIMLWNRNLPSIDESGKGNHELSDLLRNIVSEKYGTKWSEEELSQSSMHVRMRIMRSWLESPVSFKSSKPKSGEAAVWGIK